MSGFQNIKTKKKGKDVPSPEEYPLGSPGEPYKHQVESDFKTIQDHAAIQQDPERLNRLHQHASKTKTAITSIAQLRALAGKKSASPLPSVDAGSEPEVDAAATPVKVKRAAAMGASPAMPKVRG